MYNATKVISLDVYMGFITLTLFLLSRYGTSISHMHWSKNQVVVVAKLVKRACVVSPGGHDNFRKMIDEAEPLGYPVVVKNARGHRGELNLLCCFCFACPGPG